MKGIIIQPELVAVLLERGRLQTRRVIKPQPEPQPDGTWYVETRPASGYSNDETMLSILPIYCPYGQLGDMLYVKEPWRLTAWNFDDPGILVGYKGDKRKWCDLGEWTQTVMDENRLEEWLMRQTAKIADLPGVHEEPTGPLAPDEPMLAWDDDDVIPWQSPLFMPQWASRATVRIARVDVQRLGDMTEEDALVSGGWDYGSCPVHKNPIQSYIELWNEINGKKCPWDPSLWVWMLDLGVVTA